MTRKTARVEHDTLGTEVAAGVITMDRPPWLAWLERTPPCAVGGPAGPFTAHKETRATGGTDGDSLSALSRVPCGDATWAWHRSG
jgi:hypothetical protein